MKAREVRVARAGLIVLIAALAAGLTILWLTRSYTFYFDEWDFILTSPDWTLATYFQPHNEHPVILTRLVYAALLHTVGLSSYLPYMASLMALHATIVVLLFRIVRRRAGDLVALACAAMLLLLGAGWEDLLWAFQVAFLGSVACGLGALSVLENGAGRRRAVMAAALLAAAVMFSGIGVFFAAAVAVRLVLDTARRSELAWFVPVALAAAGWYVGFGSGGRADAPGLQVDNLLGLPLYVGWGIASSAGGLAGLTGPAAFAGLAVALAALAAAWWRHRPDAMVLGVAAGLVSFYAVTGLARGQLGYTQSGAGRYVYVGAVLWLILLADAAKQLPWRGTWRPVLVAGVFLCCFNSAVLLVTFSVAKTAQMQRANADLQALAAERSDPCLDPSGAVDPLVMPWVTEPRLYYRAVDSYGDPAPPVPVTDGADYEIAIHNLRRAAC